MRVKTRGFPRQPRRSLTLKGQREQGTRTKSRVPVTNQVPLMHGMGDLYRRGTFNLWRWPGPPREELTLTSELHRVLFVQHKHTLLGVSPPSLMAQAQI